MPSQRPSRWLQALLAAAMTVPTIVFLASLPWLKQQPKSLAYLAAGATAIVVIAAGLALTVLYDRKLDEWRRSGARFAGQWGVPIGTCLVGLLLVIPPLQGAMVSTMSDMIGHDAGREYKLVILAFTVGFSTVVLMQGLCTTVIYALWNFRMLRPAKDPS